MPLYLDNFIVFGAPKSEECQVALDKALQLCHQLGVPISVHKTEGLGTYLYSWG